MATSLLVAVVEDALEERALAIAREEGAMGATVISGRGIGFPEHITFFGLTFRGIEQVILWVLDDATSARIANRLNLELDLLKPFQGLSFCLPIDQAEGVDPDAIAAHIRARHSATTGDDS